MAYPYRIEPTGNLRLSRSIGIGQRAVFSYVNSLGVQQSFVVGVWVPDPSIQVWRSTDAGTTWAESDSANHPFSYAGALLGDNKYSYSVTDDPLNPHLIHIAFHATTGRYNIITFNMETNLWSTSRPGGPDQTATSSDGPYQICLRTTDLGAQEFILVMDGDSVTTDPGVGSRTMTWYARCSMSGTWTGLTEVGTGDPVDTTRNYNMIGVVRGANGRWHVFCQVFTGMQSFEARTFDLVAPAVGGNWYPFFTVTNLAFNAAPHGYEWSLPFYSGSELFFQYVAPSGGTSDVLHVARAASANDPVWTDTIVATTSGATRNIRLVDAGVSAPSQAVLDGSGSLRMVWMEYTSLKVYSSLYDGSAWGTETELVDAGALTGQPNNTNISACATPSGYAVVFGLGLSGATTIRLPYYWEGSVAANLYTLSETNEV